MFDRQLFTTLARRHRQRSSPLPWAPPVAPLPVLDDQPPVLLVFDHADLGVELAYEKRFVPGGPVVHSATRDTTLYWVPRLTPVFVVSAGTVVFARRQSEGFTIIVDHGNDWLTAYSRLEHIFVPDTSRKPRPEVKLAAGDILGYLGATKDGPLRPLRFELWRCNRFQDYDQIDPLRYMRRWRQIDWADAQLARTHPPPKAAGSRSTNHLATSGGDRSLVMASHRRDRRQLTSAPRCAAASVRTEGRRAWGHSISFHIKESVMSKAILFAAFLLALFLLGFQGLVAGDPSDTAEQPISGPPETYDLGPHAIKYEDQSADEQANIDRVAERLETIQPASSHEAWARATEQASAAAQAEIASRAVGLEDIENQGVVP